VGNVAQPRLGLTLVTFALDLDHNDVLDVVSGSLDHRHQVGMARGRGQLGQIRVYDDRLPKRDRRVLQQRDKLAHEAR